MVLRAFLWFGYLGSAGLAGYSRKFWDFELFAGQQYQQIFTLGREKKGIPTANLQIELPAFHHKKVCDLALEFSEFFTGWRHADVKTKYTLSNKSCKKK